MKFESLQPFCFLVHINMLLDFSSKCTVLKVDLLKGQKIYCLLARAHTFQPRHFAGWCTEGVKLHLLTHRTIEAPLFPGGGGGGGGKQSQFWFSFVSQSTKTNILPANCTLYVKISPLGCYAGAKEANYGTGINVGWICHVSAIKWVVPLTLTQT